MMLTEQTTAPLAALPVAKFKEHLQLGTGFTGDVVQDSVLEVFLRSAIAAIEARTGKVLLEKQYTWALSAWREACRQALPLAPVSSIEAVRTVDRIGVASVVDPLGYRLEQDTHRPVLWAVTGNLPAVPGQGSTEIDFTAGYGANWDGVPDDLALAVFMLAANFYETRGGGGTDGSMPFSVSSLIQSYRNVRILGARAT